MATVLIERTFLACAILILIVGYGTSCELNGCLCQPQWIMCDTLSRWDVIFTDAEKHFVHSLVINRKHVYQIELTCDSFPMLRYVEVHDGEDMTGDECPILQCHGVHVVCL